MEYTLTCELSPLSPLVTMLMTSKAAFVSPFASRSSIESRADASSLIQHPVQSSGQSSGQSRDRYRGQSMSLSDFFSKVKGQWNDRSSCICLMEYELVSPMASPVVTLLVSLVVSSHQSLFHSFFSKGQRSVQLT